MIRGKKSCNPDPFQPFAVISTTCDRYTLPEISCQYQFLNFNFQEGAPPEGGAQGDNSGEFSGGRGTIRQGRPSSVIQREKVKCPSKLTERAPRQMMSRPRST